MGLLLLFLVFPVCAFAVARRRRSGTNFVVPLVLALYSLASAAWTVADGIHTLAGIAGVHSAMKATLLAKGISELMNSTAFWSIVHVPLLLGAWMIDRRLRRPATG
jgi:hypothetical protein